MVGVFCSSCGSVVLWWMCECGGENSVGYVCGCCCECLIGVGICSCCDIDGCNLCKILLLLFLVCIVVLVG